MKPKPLPKTPGLAVVTLMVVGNLLLFGVCCAVFAYTLYGFFFP